MKSPYENNQPLENDEALIIDVPHLLTCLRQNAKFILSTTIACTIAASAFAFLAYQEKYSSEAKLLFNPSELPSVVSNISGQNTFLKGTLEASPFKNQEELLNSRSLANRVYKKLQEDKIPVSVKKPGELIDKVLSASHIRGTDFIKLSAVSSSPEVARKVMKVYLDSYLSMMREITYQPLEQQEKLFSQQVAKAEHGLLELNNTLQDYQQKYGIVDINTESQLKVREFESLQSDKKNVEVELAEKQGETQKLLSQLHLNAKEINTAIQSVASGQNSELTDLQSRLNKLQQDYAVKALTYAPTNPDMSKLEEEIAVLQKQIINQQIITIGNTLEAKAPLIKDDLRAGMVERLATLESEKNALRNKRVALGHEISKLSPELQELPAHQLEYARLLLDKKNRENVLTRLREKLAEVEIQQTVVQKKLTVIDKPSLPEKPSSPNRMMLILFAALGSCLLSSVAFMASALIKPRSLDADYIENVLNIPVMSTIPWLPEHSWRQYRSRNKLEVMDVTNNTHVAEAYQGLALNLRTQSAQNQQNVLVTSSIFQEAEQPFMLANLAYCLAQSGESVVLIDACLREPKLHEAFGHRLDYERGLTEVINGLSEQLFKNAGASAAELMPTIESSLLPSGVHPQLHYINAGLVMDNTFEFLNSKGFAALINVLRQYYDRVILNAPPFLKTSDAAVLLSSADGLLLFVERDANSVQIQTLQKKVHKLNSVIKGAVLREPSA